MIILNLKVINLLKFYTYLNFNMEYLIVINKQKRSCYSSLSFKIKSYNFFSLNSIIELLLRTI